MAAHRGLRQRPRPRVRRVRVIEHVVVRGSAADGRTPRQGLSRVRLARMNAEQQAMAAAEDRASALAAADTERLAGIREGYATRGEPVLPQLDQRLHVGFLGSPNHAICHRSNATGTRARVRGAVPPGGSAQRDPMTAPRRTAFGDVEQKCAHRVVCLARPFLGLQGSQQRNDG